MGEKTIQTPKFTITLRENPEGFERIDIDLPDVRIGNIRCQFMDDSVTVFSIQIFPEFQRRGYGKAAINMLKRRFQFILADRVRFAAREFWTEMGFKELPDGNWEYKGVPKTPFSK